MYFLCLSISRPCNFFLPALRFLKFNSKHYATSSISPSFATRPLRLYSICIGEEGVMRAMGYNSCGTLYHLPKPLGYASRLIWMAVLGIRLPVRRRRVMEHGVELAGRSRQRQVLRECRVEIQHKTIEFNFKYPHDLAMEVRVYIFTSFTAFMSNVLTIGLVVMPARTSSPTCHMISSPVTLPAVLGRMRS